MSEQQNLYNFINQKLSKHTKDNYERVIIRFLKWCNGEKPEGNKWVKDYQIYLKGLGLENRSINLNTVVISSYYRFCTGSKLTYDRLKETRAKIEFLSDEEVGELLNKTQMPFKVILKFMLDTGCRVSEVEEVSRQFHRIVPNEFQIMGKGNKQRIVIVSEDTRQLMAACMVGGKVFGRE